jgi:hypothetical protein
MYSLYIEFKLKILLLRVSVFTIVDSQTLINAYLKAFAFYLHTNLHMPHFNDSLIVAVNLKAK